jgi:phosphatidylserine/phosphatidylglycerophosphate/cardiolipin synthase-like enzyme
MLGTALITILLTVPVLSQENVSLELVESFPVGTDFDQADIRDCQDVWLELINEAQKEILWHTFYLAHEKGKATEPVLEALKKAAARGVKVRLLVDEKFLKTYPEPLASLNRHDNIEVRASPVGRWYGAVMHAKMILVDGEVGFIGSQNFDWRSLEHIRELGILFRDSELVDTYARVFEWEWRNFEKALPPHSRPDVRSRLFRLDENLVRPTVSPNPLNADPALGDEYQILELLRSSQDSVKIALLSYSPVTHDGHEFYAELDNAIRAATVRGVKVQLLVSHWEEEKKTFDHLVSLDVLHNVEVRACRIPLTAEGEIPFARVHHSKYLVVDGNRAWLGTSNWSRGYFRDSRNYGMVFCDGKIPQRLNQLFDFDWERSTSLRRKTSK